MLPDASRICMPTNSKRAWDFTPETDLSDVPFRHTRPVTLSVLWVTFMLYQHSLGAVFLCISTSLCLPVFIPSYDDLKEASPHSLGHLSTWFSVGWAVWVGSVGVALLEEVRHGR